MTTYADLEIGLHRRDAHCYAVELRFSQPESDAEVRSVRGDSSLVQFDFEQLRTLLLDDAAYGQYLAESLFAPPSFRMAFAKACSTAGALEVPLRLRLFVGPNAPELHDLRWETLRDPEDGNPLLTGEHVLFSRYLSSLDWRRVRLQPKANLRALVVVANPADVADYAPGGRSLTPVDVSGELQRAKSGLGAIPMTELASKGSATLNNLSHHLRDGYDILYLVAHGALVKGEPRLWLEDEMGQTQVVVGSELAIRLGELQQRPRLVVLVSCQSAGTGEDARTSDGGALAALGPRLAEVGIPAVLAMQRDISMTTVAQFMPVFFEELQRDGQIDRAAAVARGAVRERPDWWAPTLFMRLKSGRLWYTPGFARDRPGLEKWPALLRHIRQGRCTPILGPGLAETLLGSRREIARRWAETFHFPMAPHQREDLPQVAQYLAVYQDHLFPREELAEYLRQELLTRYGDDLPVMLHDAPLDALITAVGAHFQAHDPAEPNRVLAELPLPIYITTTASNLLATALAATNKDPRVELCRWNEEVKQLPSIYDDDPGYRPDPEHPLVYHLFGHLQEPTSVVLTEDDYFDYLIGVTSNKDLIPSVVRRALADTALLFLGFQMDDWNFRVLFRSLMSQEGRGRRSRYAHVAVQIDPEEGRTLSPERARRYLETYFQGADISIYWGSAEDFIRELQRRWEASSV